MKKIKLSALAVALVLFAGISVLQSCRKDYFPEFSKNNMDLDTFVINGAFAMPLINTKMTIGNFIPDTDSTLWVEADADGLLHFRMYFPNLFTYSASQVFPATVFPIPAGTPVPQNLMRVKTDSLKLKVYNSTLEGHLFFRNPIITFNVRNTIPMVTSFRMDTVAFYGDTQSSETPNSNFYTVQAPAQAGDTAKTSVIIDKNQIPTLPEVFSPVPHFVSFVISAGSVTNQTTTFGLSGNETIAIDADVDLPMDAYLTDLVRADSVKMDMNGATYSIIESATLKIELSNQLPVGAVVQIYFADSTATSATVAQNHADVVFTDTTNPDITAQGWNMEPAAVVTWGANITPTKNFFELKLDQTRIQALKDKNVTQMYVLTTLNSIDSQNQTYVKIAGNMQIGIKIGLRADYTVSTQDTIFDWLDTLTN